MYVNDVSGLLFTTRNFENLAVDDSLLLDTIGCDCKFQVSSSRKSIDHNK